MMDEVKKDPLEPLRKQWELEKSPKLSLQLAEEYGRRDDFLSAITVLRTGLTQHPRHVSSRILLARFLVELEQWPEARETLEGVAGEDPTNLIANKLLVKTCLAMGDRAEARNRLDLYILLNERDPDVERLERELAAASGEIGGDGAELAAVEEKAAPGAARDRDRAPESAAVPEAPEDRALAATPEDLLAEIGEAGGSGEEADGRPPAGEVFAPATPLPTTHRRPAPATRGGGEPFADVFASAPRDRRLAAARGGDIFELVRPVAPPPSAAPHDAPPEEPAAAEPDVGAAAIETPAAAPPEATVSLGRLYLQQGHAGEAERTFAAILEREPDSAAARVGLAAARGAGGWAVSALDLVSRETLASAAPAARKRAVLTGYLERLRPGAAAGGNG